VGEVITFIENSVCAPKGYSASGIAAGLRKSNKLDLALIYSEVPALAAGVYTKNQLKAAPLVVTKKHVQNGYLQAIMINSGNANACTGKRGLAHAELIAQCLAKQLGVRGELIGIASTGLIGVPLPTDKIIGAIPKLAVARSTQGDALAARAILTTDTFIKQIAVKVKLSDGSNIKIGGIAKGSGMVHPNMATILGFITTDVAISVKILQKFLTLAVNDSFNMISVDGDSSTNDMVLMMANQMAENPLISSMESPDGKIFYQALLSVCKNLAKQVANDGEGASKLITVKVSQAKTEKQAKLVAKSIVSSSLVKAAVFGNDANWGRIACAVGYAGTLIKIEKLSIALDQLVLFDKGVPKQFCEASALKILQQQEVPINVDLGMGDYESTAWGCDLTYDYVKINSAYRT
jgi:glutamate N-acetyltransferase / amino-acid N-acetyltransferase